MLWLSRLRPRRGTHVTVDRDSFSTGGGRRSSRWIIVTAIATCVLALTGVIGTRYVVDELQEFRHQNELLQRTLNQSYRPLASISYTESEPGVYEMSLAPVVGGRPDRYAFQAKLHIRNLGQGLMRHLGYIHYVDRDTIPFRDSYLSGPLKVLYDGLSPLARGAPLPPGESVEAALRWSGIGPTDNLFSYVLIFYEDQVGNLYDTEHLLHLKFQEPELRESGLVPISVPGGGISEEYHQYTKAERAALIKRLELDDHSLADAIRLTR